MTRWSIVVLSYRYISYCRWIIAVKRCLVNASEAELRAIWVPDPELGNQRRRAADENLRESGAARAARWRNAAIDSQPDGLRRSATVGQEFDYRSPKQFLTV